MIVYLNGCNDGQLGSLKSFFQKVTATVKKLVPPQLLPKAIIDKVVTTLKKDAVVAENSIQKNINAFAATVKLDTQKVIAAAKMEAAKLKLGIQRLASIPQQLVNKTFLNAVEHNFEGIAVRLLDGYKSDPQGLKNIWAINKGSWNDLRDAINKGAKSFIAGNHLGDDTSSSDFFMPGQGSDVSAGEDASGDTTPAKISFWCKAVGIFKQIFAWLKKLGKSKKTDDTVVNSMANYVDADPTIPKFDENGNLLPNADGTFPPEQKSSTGVLALAAAAVGAKLLLFSH